MEKPSWENWLNLLLGVWLFSTPWIFTSNLSANMTFLTNLNTWMVAAGIILSAYTALVYLKPWEEWVNLALGIWLFLSPWILGYSKEKNLFWNAVIVGLAIAVFSGVALSVTRRLQQQR